MGLVSDIGGTLGDLGTIQSNAAQNQGLIAAQTAQTQGNIAAQKISTIGQIQAQQVQANAQLWMNFANNVANMAANVPVQMAAEKKAKQESTLAAMQIDVAKQTLADKQAARAETQAIRDQIVKDGGDIIDKNILQVAPIIGADFLKTRAETATAGANAVIAKAKAESAQLQQLTQELPGVVDEPSKQAFATKVGALNPKIGDYIQKQPYSKELVDQLQTIGMDAAAKADFNVKALDKLVKQQSADKGGIELAAAGNEWLGSTLSAHPVEQWEDFLQQAAVMKVPAAVIASYREIMTDENAQAKAGQMSMTEKERETINKPPAPGAPVKVIGPDGKPVYTTAKDAIGKTPVPEAGGGGPLVAVLGPDGKPVLVPRAEAAGMTPASSQPSGRPVTSGDVGKLSELTTSLHQLDALRGAVPEGTTGVAAQAGALVPNFITEWTGVGADAKSKQAVIALVKQVIGKALEGGVLRKEDETKYKDMLPGIGDVDTVVKAKLDNLDRAIQTKRADLISGLEDAGYDTTKFKARAADAPGGGATPGGKVTVTSPGGRSYPFDSQAQADAFVRDAKAKGLWK